MIRDYRYLQSRIDELIKIVGSENASALIDIFIESKDFNLSVSNFITMCASSYYSISSDDIKKEGRSNSSARKICYKLHKDFLKMSMRKTGAIYERQENSVLKGIQRVEEVIEDPKSDMILYADFLAINNQVKRFVAFLNKDSGN